jgi:hypothetical protein
MKCDVFSLFFLTEDVVVWAKREFGSNRSWHPTTACSVRDQLMGSNQFSYSATNVHGSSVPYVFPLYNCYGYFFCQSSVLLITIAIRVPTVTDKTASWAYIAFSADSFCNWQGDDVALLFLFFIEWQWQVVKRHLHQQLRELVCNWCGEVTLLTHTRPRMRTHKDILRLDIPLMSEFHYDLVLKFPLKFPQKPFLQLLVIQFPFFQYWPLLHWCCVCYLCV